MSRLSRLADGEASVLDLLRDYYHVPLLALAVAFSLWVRTRGWRNFVTDGRVLFSGNDPWYHYRTVQYTVRNWPFTMPFDPWTGYPTGTSVGQFGTLFDQIIATVALVVGLGSPSDHTIAMVHLFAPAFFGAFALLPAYALASQVTDRLGGLVTVLFLSLTTGQFLTRGVVGFSDHNIAEAFFFAVTAAAVVAALRVALDEKPVWELVAAGDYDALRRPVAYSALAGLALTLYLWTWPPAVFFIGILGVFFAVAAAVYQTRGVSPDHVTLPGIVVGLVVAVLTLLTIDVFTIDAVKLSLLQPLLGVGLAAGCAFLAGFARLWEREDVDPRLYPAGVLGVAIVGLGLFALVLPETFDYFVGQVLRIFGYDSTAASRTVAEAKPVPLDSLAPFFQQSYGFGLFTAIGGVVFMLYKLVTADEPRADRLFLLTLTVFMFLAAITQRRFEYYFAIPVGVLNGYLAAVVFDLVGLRERIATLERPTGYQVMAVVAVLLVVVAPMTVGAQTAPAVAEQRANPGGVERWTGSLDWMEDNTPEMGAYGDGTPSDTEYYGTYDRRDDFEYGDGSYGVLAWWDYGHWITTLGHRVPNANPFQQNAKYAANVLLAPNESRATGLLSGEEQTRYVVVDYPLGMPGTRKYSAPTAFESQYDVGPRDLQRPIYSRDSVNQAIQRGNSRLLRQTLTLNKPRAYDSLRVRLYQSHGSRMSPTTPRGRVVVFDWDTDLRGVPTPPAEGNVTKTFRNMSAARDYVASDGTAQIGGTPNFPAKTVSALQHFRLVHASNESRIRRSDRQVYAAVKTFERVPGATATVRGPPNTTVTASVRMVMTARDRQRLGIAGGRIQPVSTGQPQTFVYRQQATTNADGVATFTLPYSTAGYEQYGTDEGYTNVSVRAAGPYRFATPTQQENLTTYYYNGTADVTEGQVVGENESATTVELERTVLDEPEGKNTTDSDAGSEASLPSPDDTVPTTDTQTGPQFAARSV